jgi:hypothetical protein
MPGERRFVLGLTIFSFILYIVFWCIDRFLTSYIFMVANVYILFFGSFLAAGFAFLLNLQYYSRNVKPKGWIWFIFLRLFYIFILGISLFYGLSKMHDSTSPAFLWKYSAEDIYNEFHEYTLKNKNILPEANSWCDQLLTTTNDSRHLQWFFQKQREHFLDKMAFNRYLSNKDFSKIDGSLVMLFDTNSVGNANGTEDMLNQFASKNQGHVFVLFADGKFADYDAKEKSLRFLELGLREKNYLPLRWKP